MASSLAAAVGVAVLAVFGGFLAWTPAPIPEGHFSDAPFDWPAELEYRSIKAADDLNMMCYSIGPEAPAERRGSIIFVHGFPESAASWKEYVMHFGKQGFYTLACDQRNVNNSVSTSGNRFSFDQMADDIKGLVDAIGEDRVAVVGHDWGAIAAQVFTLKYPEMVSALVTMAVPHLELYRWYNTLNLLTALKNVWGVLFLGLTGPVARWKIAKDDFGWFLRYAFSSSNPGAYSKSEIARIKEMWRRRLTDPAASTVTTWYKPGVLWFLKGSLPPGASPGFLASMWSNFTAVEAPTLQLHGRNDVFLTGEKMIEAYPDQNVFFSHAKSQHKVYPTASHWINREFVADAIADISAFFDAVLP